MKTRRKYSIKHIPQTHGLLNESRADYQPSAIVLYQAANGKVRLEVRLEQETLWMTQKQMAELFNTERSVITKHLHNIFVSHELVEKSNVQKMHIAKSDKPVAFYNLDVIISLGYRVNSKRGTKRIADNALVAMTLLIAESHPQEKDLLCRVLVNLIKGSARR